MSRSPKTPRADATAEPPGIDHKLSHKRGSLKSRKGIQSVEIGLRVLGVLAEAYRPMALKDIGQGAGLSASQAHRYLTSLTRQEMVTQDPGTGRYALGKMALRVGLSALNSVDALHIAETGLVNMVDRIGLTGMLSIWGERGAIVIRWRRGRSLILSSLGVGTIFPLLTTATGRIFLSFMPSAVVHSVLDTELGELRARGRPMSRDEIDALIADVRREGYAQIEEQVPGMRSMAAPILDFQGEIVAVLCLVGNVPDPFVSADEMRRELLRTAADVSARIGFAGEWRPPYSPR